jgi:hypothetical protein
MNLRVVLLGCAAVAATVAVLPAAQAADAGAPALPACMQVTSEARYVPYGYNHIVVLKNGCSHEATCSVSTDVNPEPQTVDVKAGATAEVVTFMGSPSQKFAARVSCKLH